MKWKQPKINDTKIKKRFAWWPMKADDGYVYWLEFVYKHYVCEMYQWKNSRGEWKDLPEWTLAKTTKHA